MILFDTSVLVAANVAAHPFHARSLKVLQEASDGRLKGAVCAHTLAEYYSVMTAYPMQPRMTPVLVERLITENILPHFQVVELQVQDYRQAIRRVRERNLWSGAVYDALLIQAAIKKKAVALMTWDKGDFHRLTDDEAFIREP